MRLERFTVDDRELLDKLVFNSDVMTMNYGRVFTEDEAGAFFGAITALNGRDDVFGYFKVFAGSGEEFIGLAALVPGEYPGHAETEYMLLPGYWGRGYGTALVSRLIDMSEKAGTVTVLEAFTDPSNSRSRRVLQKNGFRSAGAFTNEEGEPAELFTLDLQRKKNMPKVNIELYRPSLNDLSFREIMLNDADTMSYNAAWGGTIPFPMEDWADWYDHWITFAGSERFYRYVKDAGSGELIGEAAYHLDGDRGMYMADIIIFAPYRNRGYGTVALQALCDEAAKRGVEMLYDDIAADNPGISLFLRAGFTEECRTDEIIMLRKDLRAQD